MRSTWLTCSRAARPLASSVPLAALHPRRRRPPSRTRSSPCRMTLTQPARSSTRDHIRHTLTVSRRRQADYTTRAVVDALRPRARVSIAEHDTDLDSSRARPTRAHGLLAIAHGHLPPAANVSAGKTPSSDLPTRVALATRSPWQATTVAAPRSTPPSGSTPSLLDATTSTSRPPRTPAPRRCRLRGRRRLSRDSPRSPSRRPRVPAFRPRPPNTSTRSRRAGYVAIERARLRLALADIRLVTRDIALAHADSRNHHATVGTLLASRVSRPPAAGRGAVAPSS
jgi:hypothetical protein